MIQSYSKFTNNDLKKFYLFAHSDRFSFSHIDSLVRSVSENIFLLLTPPGIFKGNIDPTIPILNYGNKPELQELIDKGIVQKKMVYNLPEFLKNANSKVEFHKKTKDLNFVPKSVFTKEKALKDLKFPIIAKPDTGSKGEGIEVFKTKEDLTASKTEFQVFSEKFNLVKEFRVISINGEPVYIAERIPMNKKANSLREGKDIFDREGTLSKRSSYKWRTVNFEKITDDEKKLKKICKTINESLRLEFLGIDIGVDDKGKIFVIEANTCPGLNKNQITKIYEQVFKDFYERDLDKHSKQLLNKYDQELIRANKDKAKFSFSPHGGKRFYYYDDKIDMETGKHQGKKILTVKYDIEKSMGDTLLNIKDEYMKESKIMNFESFSLNESLKNSPEINTILQNIFSGKQKPTSVEPHEKNNKLNFQFLEIEEDDNKRTREEEITLNFIDDEYLLVKFQWSYSIEKGQKSSNSRINPDDPTEYYLDDITIDEIIYYMEEESIEIRINEEILSKMKEYIAGILPVDGVNKKYKK